MTKKLLIVFFLISTGIGLASADTSFLTAVDLSYGYSGSSGSYFSGYSIGNDYFSEPDYFGNPATAKFAPSFAATLHLGFDFDRVVKLSIYAGFNDREFHTAYPKNTAPSDFEISASYRFFSTGAQFKHILASPFYYATGLNLSILLDSSSFFRFNGTVAEAPFGLINSMISIPLELGLSTTLANDASLDVGVYMNFGLNDIFPYSYFFDIDTLVDLGIKVSISVMPAIR